MAQITTAPVASPLRISTDTRLGAVHLDVTDVERALLVWRDLVGLTVLGEEGGDVRLGAGGQTLIVLHSGATQPVVQRTSGLYHVAIHVPSRVDLARVIARLYQAGYYNAPTDHLVTETTYLWDPDGIGIEVTFETPERGTFVMIDGQFAAIDTAGNYHSGREAVDLDSLFADLPGGDPLTAPLPAGIRVGHVHLHVADLDAAMRFYSEVIGFQEQFQMRRIQMGDVTLPGYVPHIIAFNTWAGVGAPPPPAGASGLRYFTIVLPDAAALADVLARLEAANVPVTETPAGIALKDPSGNNLLLTVRP